MDIWLYDLSWNAELASHHTAADVTRIQARIQEFLDSEPIQQLSYDVDKRTFSIQFTTECGYCTADSLYTFSKNLAEAEAIVVHYHWDLEHCECFDMTDSSIPCDPHDDPGDSWDFPGF